MLVSCRYCNQYHNRKDICSNKPKRIKENNNIVRFRSSRMWKKKSLEIRKRDSYLCLACLYAIDTPDNKPRYTFKELQVHHITPIASDYTRRLDNENLITLCTMHHSKADNKEIDSKVLLDIVRDINNKMHLPNI
jgi:5-methylcytosine-specific restriction endonuclease McrA